MESSGASRMWYLRANDETFGPVEDERFVQWAKEGRIQPGQVASTDGCNWQHVEDIPFLEMHFLLDVGDDCLRGPFTREVAEMLLNSGNLPVGSKIVDTSAISSVCENHTENGKERQCGKVLATKDPTSAVDDADACGTDNVQKSNIRKVAIVGVEGSGKTVMLAGLGDLYSHPDENGFFLAPKNFETSAYVGRQISIMRSGRWPSATVGDEFMGLNWILRRQVQGNKPEDVCEVSFLDFAGETYRAAFGVCKLTDDATSEKVQLLKSYIRSADELLVLINLRDIISYGVSDMRTQESMWITNSILKYALIRAEGVKTPHAAIVLSQADAYDAIIRECGGAAQTLSKYLPHVANNYSWIDVLSAKAIDSTMIDPNGLVIPNPDFKTTGLAPMMHWIIRRVVNQPGFFGLALQEITGEDAPVDVKVEYNDVDPMQIPLEVLEKEMYQSGYRDLTPAQKEFLKSGSSGRPGGGLSKLRAEAIRLYEKGLRCEQRSKGFLFKKRNYAAAVAWWMKSAELNYAPAQKKLGDVYYDLDNGYWNPDEALKWYLLAAKQGNPDAQFEVGNQCWSYGKLKDSMEEARLYALKWFRLSAQQGHAGSLSRIASYVELGSVGVPRDERKAYALYQKSLNMGYHYAASDLMRMHEKHPDYEIDYHKIASALQKAAVNDVDCQRQLAVLYENGWGMPKNLELALQYYQCAAGDNYDAQAAVVRVSQKLGYT